MTLYPSKQAASDLVDYLEHAVAILSPARDELVRIAKHHDLISGACDSLSDLIGAMNQEASRVQWEEVGTESESAEHSAAYYANLGVG